MKINVKIDKLVLHGFSPHEQTNIQNMIITELTSTLKTQNPNLYKTTQTKPLTYNVNSLKINTTANPQKIGQQIAHNIKNKTTPQ
ncbi:hypothetical protein [Candidatus Bathycorpusculum sp.]|jgi:hypothetical protein|uniref:hypothetical protein n=1 Tax=Candidatus Bathycorpusculum sp. TaxID=2994959 RepID=UPI00282CEEA9|nr:hypothetical protein [Candidatus Termitimicrobium sp.]